MFNLIFPMSLPEWTEVYVSLGVWAVAAVGRRVSRVHSSVGCFSTEFTISPMKPGAPDREGRSTGPCLRGPVASVTLNLLLFRTVSFHFPLTLVAVGWGSVWLICLRVRCTHFSGRGQI